MTSKSVRGNHLVACAGKSPQCQSWRRIDCSTCAGCKRERGDRVHASIGLRFGNLLETAAVMGVDCAALSRAIDRRGPAPDSWLQLEVAAPSSVDALTDQLARVTAQLDASWSALSAAGVATVGAGWECCLVDALSGACARAHSSCTGCHPIADDLFGPSGSVTALTAMAQFMVMTAPVGPGHICTDCPQGAHESAAGMAPRPEWLVAAWTARLHSCLQDNYAPVYW